MSARVLMVDDEPDAEELFRQNFRREIRKGIFVFDFALSGSEALKFLDSEEVPETILILSDINMPGMTGIELLETIKTKWPDIPIFMITAYGDKQTEIIVREKGASEFLTKPVDYQILKNQLLTIVAEVSE
ncbi:MAG: response regulator [Sneathiella sp.]|uniref:response regulator n=1 Tax=Sneathiella sp. TaxID=1964365 RepID=UPI003001557A